MVEVPDTTVYGIISEVVSAISKDNGEIKVFDIATNNSQVARVFTEEGFQISESLEQADIIVSFPPLSERRNCLYESSESNKPFFLLLPTDTVGLKSVVPILRKGFRVVHLSPSPVLTINGIKTDNLCMSWFLGNLPTQDVGNFSGSLLFADNVNKLVRLPPALCKMNSQESDDFDFSESPRETTPRVSQDSSEGIELQSIVHPFHCDHCGEGVDDIIGQCAGNHTDKHLCGTCANQVEGEQGECYYLCPDCINEHVSENTEV